MVCNTQPSQDAFIHQIWNSYLKEYRRYASDSMPFLETRSEVKVKVTVTQGWSLTLRLPTMHAHTKYEIPTSNNMRYALDTRILKTSVEVKFSDPKTVHDTPLSQDASTHQKCLGTKNLIAKKKNRISTH